MDKAQANRAVHPLVYPAGGLLAGIYLAHWLAPPAWPLLAGAALAGGGLIYAGLRWGRFPAWGLAALGLLLGSGLLALQQSGSPPAGHLVHRADGRIHQVVLDILRAPEPTAHGWRTVAAARQVDGRPASGRLRLSGPARRDPPRVGQRLRVWLKLRPFISFANPGGFDYAAHMARQGLLVRARVSARHPPQVLGPGEVGWLWQWLESARARLGRLLQSLPPGQGRALLRAILLGQRGELSARLRQAFGGLGAAHLLAISGLHLGLVWAMAYGLLRALLALWPALALRWPAPRLAAVGALLPALAYAGLAGWSTPTLRAVIMTGALVLALGLGRDHRPDGALALACLVIGLAWPRAPLTISFQLSFVAVATILAGFVPLLRRWPATGWQRVFKALAGWLGLSAMLALALWPLAAGHFHQLPLWSVPANALLVPLVGFITLPLGLLGAGLGFTWPAGGAWLLGLGGLSSQAAAELALAMASLPGGLVYVAGPGPWTALAFYGGAVITLLWPGRRRWMIGAAIMVLALAAALWPPTGTRGDGRLTAWVLDVGQGSSTVVRLPQGQVMVIDGGGWPGSDFDFGRTVVAPVLWRLGLPGPRVVACSHRQADHAGGLAFVVRQFRPAEVWLNRREPRRGSFQRLLDAAAQAGARLLDPAQLAGRRELGGARLRVVWPPAQGLDAGTPENDQSLWIGLGLGSTWLWLPGDAGPGVERRVAAGLPRGGDHILVAPHHGGRGALTPQLLAALRPRVVVISVGCHNRFGMPFPEVLARARAAGARVLTTARHGALRLVSDGKAWQVEPYLARGRQCPGRPKP